MLAEGRTVDKASLVLLEKALSWVSSKRFGEKKRASESRDNRSRRALSSWQTSLKWIWSNPQALKLFDVYG